MLCNMASFCSDVNMHICKAEQWQQGTSMSRSKPVSCEPVTHTEWRATVHMYCPKHRPQTTIWSCCIQCYVIMMSCTINATSQKTLCMPLALAQDSYDLGCMGSDLKRVGSSHQQIQHHSKRPHIHSSGVVARLPARGVP